MPNKKQSIFMRNNIYLLLTMRITLINPKVKIARGGTINIESMLPVDEESEGLGVMVFSG